MGKELQAQAKALEENLRILKEELEGKQPKDSSNGQRRLPAMPGPKGVKAKPAKAVQTSDKDLTSDNDLKQGNAKSETSAKQDALRSNEHDFDEYPTNQAQAQQEVQSLGERLQEKESLAAGLRGEVEWLRNSLR